MPSDREPTPAEVEAYLRRTGWRAGPVMRLLMVGADATPYHHPEHGHAYVLSFFGERAQGEVHRSVESLARIERRTADQVCADILAASSTPET